MRYYRIRITNQDTGELIKEFTSLNTLGQTIPGALNVEFDIPVFRMAEPAGAAYVKVWGISIQDIGQALDLTNRNIEIYAGMQKGLPLANPKQSGLILQGTIQQAFGNWQAMEQSLDLIVNVIGESASDPKNITLNWRKGQALGDAVKATLAIAFPAYTAQISTTQNLVLNQDEVGYYENITQFADYVKIVSQHIVNDPAYQGVDILVKDKTFIISDGSTAKTPKNIEFTDLIGQPTWIAFSSIIFKCVMRADISVGDYIKMPPSPQITTAQSYSQYRDKAAFNGVFVVKEARHMGNFRQPDANSWVTTFEAYIA
ncbi:MAG: hypothetical protein JO253_02915 [Alphaproteobacteria bacterium]|nr:hypothetical protein [Alphaproteobacteria bacterium]